MIPVDQPKENIQVLLKAFDPYKDRLYYSEGKIGIWRPDEGGIWNKIVGIWRWLQCEFDTNLVAIQISLDIPKFYNREIRSINEMDDVLELSAILLVFKERFCRSDKFRKENVKYIDGGINYLSKLCSNEVNQQLDVRNKKEEELVREKIQVNLRHKPLNSSVDLRVSRYFERSIIGILVMYNLSKQDVSNLRDALPTVRIVDLVQGEVRYKAKVHQAIRLIFEESVEKRALEIRKVQNCIEFRRMVDELNLSFESNVELQDERLLSITDPTEFQRQVKPRLLEMVRDYFLQVNRKFFESLGFTHEVAHLIEPEKFQSPIDQINYSVLTPVLEKLFYRMSNSKILENEMVNLQKFVDEFRLFLGEHLDKPLVEICDILTGKIKDKILESVRIHFKNESHEVQEKAIASIELRLQGDFLKNFDFFMFDENVQEALRSSRGILASLVLIFRRSESPPKASAQESGSASMIATSKSDSSFTGNKKSWFSLGKKETPVVDNQLWDRLKEFSSKATTTVH